MKFRLPILAVLLALAGCEGTAQQGEAYWVIPDSTAPWPDAIAGDNRAGDDATGDRGAEDETTTDQDGETSPACTDDEDCPAGHVCDDHSCVPMCTPEELACDGLNILECAADGLSWLPAGTCDDGDSCTEDDCVAGDCLHEPIESCCEPPCPMGQFCFDGECVCAAQCLGKQCGDDGCGGSCGECPEQHHCTPAGLCVCDPFCVDKHCGPDGCGGSCGTCEGPQDICMDGQCICQPACAGKDCGSDGCSGTCGACPTQHECTDEGLCVCVPDCAGKLCGPDGCDGSCGGCDAPVYLCDEGQCVQDPTFAPVLGGCAPHLHGQGVYYVCWDSKKWDKAKDYCSDHGTWLVAITSDDEQTFVAGLAAAVSQTLWIGLKQGFWEWDPFEWITGEGKPVEYWSNDEPNDGGVFSSEDCGELKPTGKWNDNQCSEEQWFLCEYGI